MRWPNDIRLCRTRPATIAEIGAALEQLNDLIAAILDGRIDGYNLSGSAFDDRVFAWTDPARKQGAQPGSKPPVLYIPALTPASDGRGAYIRRKGTDGIEILVDAADSTNGRVCLVDVRDKANEYQLLSFLIDTYTTANPGGTILAPRGTLTFNTGGAHDLIFKRNGTEEGRFDGTNLEVAKNIAFKSGTSYKVTFDHAVTAARTLTAPDQSGTIALAGATAKSFWGLRCRYSSATQIIVSAGGCRDAANAFDLSIASEQTVPLGTVAAAETPGLDEGAATPADSTVAFAGATELTGTGTQFLTAFGTRALTGTIGTGGAASTTITGSGTKFCTELEINDLIGNAAVGYARIETIDSDTSLTVGSNLTITNGSSGNAIENPTINVDTGGTPQRRRVESISSDTTLYVTSNFSGTLSGKSWRVGCEPDAPEPCWLYVWAVRVSGADMPIVSTQYTTPFLSHTAKRLIFAIRNDASGDLEQFSDLSNGGRARGRLQTEYWGLTTGGLDASFTPLPWSDLVPAGTEAVSIHLGTDINSTPADGSQNVTALSLDGTNALVNVDSGYTDSGEHGANGQTVHEIGRASGNLPATYYKNAAGGNRSSYIAITGWERDR